MNENSCEDSPHFILLNGQLDVVDPVRVNWHNPGYQVERNRKGEEYSAESRHLLVTLFHAFSTGRRFTVRVLLPSHSHHSEASRWASATSATAATVSSVVIKTSNHII